MGPTRNPRRIAIAVLLVFAAAVAADAQQDGSSGLPLPRFVSLRAGEVNLRTGPGVQYPIEWIYQRQSLPVEIIAEHTTWRKIRDWEGAQGWVHQSMLGAKRSMIVVGGTRNVYRKPDPAGTVVARAEPGVIGKLAACPDGTEWCRVEIEGIEGWLKRSDFWGVYRGEVLE
ncbi:MAG: hypothetical protein EXQ86_01330 [Rhodospirillales bacterium]|nr:hypothetical protein [Rhodospirillales bacterium]